MSTADLRPLRVVRVFVSSPGDVVIERERIDVVARRLNEAFGDRLRIETIRWERKFYSSHGGFQEQIAPSQGADVVLAIFWARLGTPLPESFARMESGERFPSGSAYEVLTAIEARKKGDRPDVYVFRKTEPSADDSDEAKAQRKDLSAFFARWFQAPDGQFLRAFHRFQSADEFERQVDRLLRDWIAEHVPRDRSLIWPVETKGSPFRALLPFDAKHAAIYFGRDRKVTRALEQLQGVAHAHSSVRSGPRNVPFLLIVGESGAGKSSLMRAGLAPRLTAPGVVPAVDLWRTAVVRIGDDPSPFLSLAKALFVENDEIGGFGAALPELHAGICPTPDLLADLLSRGGVIGRRNRAPAARPILAALASVQAAAMRQRQTRRRLRPNLLILVDQLENIFATNVTDEQSSAFARLLFALCATRRVFVATTLRSDIYPRLITPGDFLALKDAGTTYDLAAPGESELSEIVHKSAAAAGLVYERDPATGKRLDEVILADAHGKNTLPLLQFALERLFEQRAEVGDETRLTFEAYAGMGGLGGAINQTAEAALAPLGEAELEALPRLLRCLAVPVNDYASPSGAGGELTVRFVPEEEAVPDAATERLVKALVEARIIVAARSEEDLGQKPLVGVSHQRVFESWERAHRIIAEHRDFFRIREEVESQYQRWEEKQRPAALLLGKGVPLAEGQKIVRHYGAELSPQMRAYVAASTRRAQRLNVFMGATAAVFAVLFVIATVLGLMTKTAQETAAADYAAARDTIDGLIAGITTQLSRLAGIRVTTINGALGVISGAIDTLRAKSGGDPSLDRSEAVMLYQFAKVYQAAKDLNGETKNALRSLGILKRLTHFDERASAPALFAAAPPQWRWDLADSLDFEAFLARDGRPADARAEYEDSLSIRHDLVKAFPENIDWSLGISRSLVQIGDAYDAEASAPGADGDRRRAHLDSARRHYRDALNNSIAVLRRKSKAAACEPRPGDASLKAAIDSCKVERELSWDFNKLGDVETKMREFPAALSDYVNGACLRRHIYDLSTGDDLARRDLAYSLGRLGRAQINVNDIAAAHDAYLEALVLRDDLYGEDRGNMSYLEDRAVTLDSIGDFYLRTDQLPLAVSAYAAAVAARDDLVTRNPDDLKTASNLNDSRKRLDAARQKAASRPAADSAAASAPESDLEAEERSFRRRLGKGDTADTACWAKIPAILDALAPPAQASAAP